MPLIKVIKDNKEFHLELWNEESIVQLELTYEIVPIIKDIDYVLSTIEDLHSTT